MSQNDFTIGNQAFPAFRADLNTALQALATNNSGATAPSTTFANMWWYETDTNIMYIRNEDNDAWIKFAELDQTNDKFVLSGTLQLDDGTVSAPALTFNSDTNMGIYRGGTDILKFVTAGTDAITINADQNVLVGTASASASGNLIVGDTSGGVIALTKRADAYSAGDVIGSLDWYTEDASLDGPNLTAKIVATAHGVSGDDANLAFFTKSATGGANATETMRLTLDGNLLLAKVESTSSTVGCELNAIGRAMFTRSEGHPLILNRITDDGSIIEFRKDNSVKGYIGNAGARLFINSGTVGLNFAGDGSDQILPSNAGANRDNAITLGATNVRFKDIYLSGGAFLGGTGTANKLDDYEEGTWTPTLQNYAGTPTIESAIYTKVGRLVYASCAITLDGTSDASGFSILTMPFASLNTDSSAQGGVVTYTDSDKDDITIMQANNASACTIFQTDGSTYTYNEFGNNKQLRCIIIYSTA